MSLISKKKILLKKKLLKRLRNFCNTETNIMLVGATGCGKSSTINALFSCGEEENIDAELQKQVLDNVEEITVYKKKKRVSNKFHTLFSNIFFDFFVIFPNYQSHLCCALIQ